MIKIIPSLPASSFSELETLVDKLGSDIDEIQVDIVDGQYVAAKSWPFTESDPVEALQKLLSLPKRLQLEIDCMVDRPEQYFDIFVALGVKKVVLHYGSTRELKGAIDFLRANKIKIGIAFTNDIPLNNIEPFVNSVDYLQVMGIATVGAQGQPFDERTLNTVKTLRESYPDLTIAVDGSVNEKTVVALKEAGANRFLPGSAIAKADDPKSALASLQLLIATH